MTAKEFFKSTAFKCIAVLLSIVLICGVLLTFCNALFFVPQDERTARAVAKVFPNEEVTFETDEVNRKYADASGFTISQAFTMTGEHEGEYLLEVVGKGGYKSGTVTCWVLAEAVGGDTSAPGEFTGIIKVVITANEKQSFIGNITGDSIQAVIDCQDEEGFSAYTTDGIKTGATFTLGAIASAMNGAKSYIESVYCGLANPYEDWIASSMIDRTTAYTVSGGVVTYNIVTLGNSPVSAFNITVTVGADKKISAFEITKDGSTDASYSSSIYSGFVGKDAAFFAGIIGENGENATNSNYGSNGITTGATRSNYLCLSAALFATANYDTAVAEGGSAQ